MNEETTAVVHLCEEEGCTNIGIPCYLPNEDENPTEEPKPNNYYCGSHTHKNGFCWGCGLFWGGVESFDFGAGARTGLCENCISSGEFEDVDEDEDEMDRVYSTYPFDAEEDWHDWRNE